MMDLFPKDFDGWIIKKKEYHYRKTKPPMFKERDIWWASIGVNVGFEEDGKHEKFIRPVLVIKKFNRELFLGIPMSTKIKDNRYYVQVTVKNRDEIDFGKFLSFAEAKEPWLMPICYIMLQNN